MGGLILVASVIIWALSYFPRYEASQVPDGFRTEALAELPELTLEESSEQQIEDLITKEYQQEHSILGYIGKGCEPLVRPMDFDWKICCSLIAGCAAKEVVVTTLGVLYVGDDDADLLSERLKTPSKITGKAPFNKAKAIAFLVFVLLYFPCIATVTAIVKESGSWKYGAFTVLYNTTLAWVLSFIVYRIAILF